MYYICTYKRIMITISYLLAMERYICLGFLRLKHLDGSALAKSTTEQCSRPWFVDGMTEGFEHLTHVYRFIGIQSAIFGYEVFSGTFI